MMNQYEVPAFLEDTIPEIRETIVRAEVQGNILNPFTAVQCLADFTLRNAKVCNTKMLRRCFSAAEKLYNKGNEAIKAAVEVVFIHSFSLLFTTLETTTQRLQVKELIPAKLYTAYIKQIEQSNY